MNTTTKASTIIDSEIDSILADLKYRLVDLVNSAYDEGKKEGDEEGYQRGHSAGYDEGYDEGMDEKE